MAYNKPAVLVYQELINAGGAANISPDQPACIIGPANNVVAIDFDDSIAKARSLAATIDTINTVNPTTLAAADWAIPVNEGSSFAGQIIDDTSVQVTLENPLVLTYHQTAVSFTNAGVGSLDATQNQVGAANNGPNNALPWAGASQNHINIGDTAILTDGSNVETVTFVTAVAENNTGVTVAATPTSGTYDLKIYVKFSSSEATVDWDETSNVLNLGNVAATTWPAGSTQTDPADQYRYYVEREVKGFGDPVGVYIGYTAARADLVGEITVVSDTTDLENKLGQGHPDDNPLAFGVGLALANSGGAPVYAIAIDQGATSPLVAHTEALQLAEGQLLYWMVPLTTDPAIQAAYKAHVDAMSTPANGNWRVALFNQALPDVFYVLGRPDGGDSNGDGYQDNLVTGTASGSTILLSSGDVATTKAADNLVLVSDTGTETTLTVASASGNMIVTTTAPATQGQVRFYVSRTASRQEQAQAVADQSATWVDKRVLNFPGEVRVNTDVTGVVVPGYYLMCAAAGFGSGTPAQQGFTNITLAGIAGLQNGNFYFTQAQLDLMAEFGTFLYVQESQETTPYCRHGLTTDVSVLEYREILKVKNWDYLSYYYKNILSPFIGTWNITPDTIQTIRQTIISGSETLLGRRLPKIGPPLLSYNIARLEQDPNNTDALNVDIQIAIVSPNNYTNVYLQI